MLGLALSGGGFRAALYHVGVLAQLARLGVLRHVAVLSACSGGSPIGALYCLRLKQLADRQRDLTPAGYCELVRTIETEFLVAVQRNLRVRAYLNPWKSLAGANRMAELFDEHVFGRAIPLRDLRSPGLPRLIINAANLKTGHNWRFEAAGMAEPARDDPVFLEIDRNRRYSTPLPADVTLGVACVASAGFPGVVPPLALGPALLADGGIYDDRAIDPLLDVGCTRFIISDASPQLPDDEHPRTSTFYTLLRGSRIWFDRLRQLQLLRLLESQDRPVAYPHLRKGLGSPIENPEDFGVDRTVQERLMRVRIDLDSFSDVEAFSLMLDGYLITGRELRKVRGFEDLIAASPIETPFRFLQMQARMRAPDPAYLRQLDVAAKLFFKVFRLSAAPWLAAAVLLAVIWPWLLLLLAVAAAAGAVGALGVVWRPAEVPARLLARRLLAALASPVVALHLAVFDPWFLRLGKVASAAGPASRTAAANR